MTVCLHLNRGDESDRLLCPREIAERTGLSYHAVLRAIHRGELRAFRLCQRIRVRPVDLAAWIEQSRIGRPGANVGTSPLFSLKPQGERGSLAALRSLEKGETDP
jgi:excisionase family DNA binding protein